MPLSPWGALPPSAGVGSPGKANPHGETHGVWQYLDGPRMLARMAHRHSLRGNEGCSRLETGGGRNAGRGARDASSKQLCTASPLFSFFSSQSI